MLDTIKKKRQDGFTIIEVVIVLAIAGLIFLVVFLAVPQLQASRRDTQRRSDAGRLGAAIEQIAANSQGTYPADNTDFSDFGSNNINVLLDNNLEDPSTGDVYEVETGSTFPSSPANYVYKQGGTCDEADGSNGDINDGTAQRVFAVSIGLEGGGAACYDVE